MKTFLIFTLTPEATVFTATATAAAATAATLLSKLQLPENLHRFFTAGPANNSLSLKVVTDFWTLRAIKYITFKILSKMDASNTGRFTVGQSFNS